MSFIGFITNKKQTQNKKVQFRASQCVAKNWKSQRIRLEFDWILPVCVNRL